MNRIDARNALRFEVGLSSIDADDELRAAERRLADMLGRPFNSLNVNYKLKQSEEYPTVWTLKLKPKKAVKAHIQGRA